MAFANKPDPRFDGRTLTYDPVTVKRALLTYYRSLSKLPYIEDSDIVTSPEEGWPNITQSNFTHLRKSDSVIELLRHLPFLRNSNFPKGYTIAPSTFVIDYSAEPFKIPLDIDKARKLSPDLYEEEEEKVKSWVIPLTRSEDRISGVWWMLDTTDGTVTDWAHNDSMEADIDYDIDDPRAWRNVCGETRLLTDLLMEWTAKFEGLHWIACSEVVWDAKEDLEKWKQLRRIIRSHGWPGEFRREACKDALLEWEEANQG